MPFDGSGNYTPAAAPNFPAIGGTTISSTYYNAVINDLATALNNVLTRDGQGRPSATQNWNNQNLTNVNALSGVSGTFSGALQAASATFSAALPVTSGGTGVTTATGTGAVVLSTNPILVTPNLGTPSAATLTNATGLPIVAGTTGTLSVARGGTGTTTAFTPGAVVFAGASGVYSQDATAFFWDDTNNRLGIGTASPAGRLDIAGTTSTISFNTAGDQMSFANNGFNYITASGAAATLRIQATGATGALSFLTNATEAMYIGSNGRVGIGTNSPSSALHVNGSGDTRFTLGNPSAALQFGVEAAGPCFITNNVAQPFYIMTNNVERFRITATGGITSSSLADAVGYKGLPQNAQTGAYALTLADMGKVITITTGGITIPANASVAFPIGSAISIYNDSATSQSIAITTDTMRQAGTTNTGTRTLAGYGVATLLKVGTTTWIISGSGVS